MCLSVQDLNKLDKLFVNYLENIILIVIQVQGRNSKKLMLPMKRCQMKTENICTIDWEARKWMILTFSNKKMWQL
jgi:hypothetical protein